MLFILNVIFTNGYRIVILDFISLATIKLLGFFGYYKLFSLIYDLLCFIYNYFHNPLKKNISVLFFIKKIHLIYLDFYSLSLKYSKSFSLFKKIYISLFFLILLNNDFYLNMVFVGFTVSILTLVYILYLDLNFSNKHRFLFKLLFFLSCIIILISIFIFFKVLIFNLKILFDYLLKTKNLNNTSSNSNKTDPWNNSPQNNSNGPDPGGSNGGINNNTGETKQERKRRLDRERRKSLYKNNKQSVLDYQKNWREENREKVRQANKKYREENREKVRQTNKEYRKKYREENREKVRQVDKKYREEHREEINQKNRERRYADNKLFSDFINWKGNEE